jgi:hypothetical protein
LGVVVGVAATCAAFWLLFFVVGLPLLPTLLPEGSTWPKYLLTTGTGTLWFSSRDAAPYLRLW